MPKAVSWGPAGGERRRLTAARLYTGRPKVKVLGIYFC